MFNAIIWKKFKSLIIVNLYHENRTSHFHENYFVHYDQE